MRGKLCLGFLLVLILIPVMIVGGYLGFRALGGILIIADPLEPAGAVVALSGDSGDRIKDAAELINKQVARFLFLTNIGEPAVSNMQSLAAKLGIPYRRMKVTESVVSNTVEEARAIRHLAEDNGVDSLIVITDPFHTLRTRLIFRRELSGSGIALQVRPVSGHWYRSDTWWKTPEGIQYTLEEYSKILFVLLNLH